MEAAKNHITKLCGDSITMITDFKTETSEVIGDIKRSTSRIANITDDHAARIKICEEELKS